MELITRNPFQNHDCKLVIKDATYLTLDELQIIEQKEFKIEIHNQFICSLTYFFTTLP